MDLKYPNSNIDFIITPHFFLGDFDIYDREETLGEYLNNFNPNNRNELKKLLDENFFSGGRIKNFTNEHRHELMKVLGEALSDKDYNFHAIIFSEDEYFYFPSNWEIEDPRCFFEVIYSEMYKKWGNDLNAKGFSIPSLY